MLAVGAACAVAVVAWRIGALTGDGAAAAAAVGSIVFGAGGLPAALLLVLFFVSASALSALPSGRERGRRRAGQVLANGGVAALALLLPLDSLGNLAFLGAIATATADTWATEIGERYGGRPRSILGFQPVEAGTSGALSLPGTLTSVVGAALVAVAGAALMAPADDRTVLPVLAGGLAGTLVDSLLGAGLQARYRCHACGRTVEAPWHSSCSSEAARVSGIPALQNDGVNGLATLAGAVTAMTLYLVV